MSLDAQPPEGGDYDTAFSEPTLFVPIDRKAMDGSRQLVRRGTTYAAAQWTGDFWSYPYGKEEGGAEPERVDFIPSHYAPKDETGRYSTLATAAT